MRTFRRPAGALSASLGAATLVLLVAAGPARADMTLKDFRAYQGGAALPAAVRNYVEGLGTGFVWANALLAARDQLRIFCAPETRPASDDFVGMLDAQIASHAGMRQPYDDEATLAMILLDALINAYPCPAPAASAAPDP